MTDAEFSAIFGLSTPSVAKSLRELRADGLIVSKMRNKVRTEGSGKVRNIELTSNTLEQLQRHADVKRVSE